MIIFKKYERTN